MKRRIRITHALLAVALAAPALLLGAQAAEASWTLETVPLPSGVTAPTLTGVSCPSATACIAVGYGQKSTGTGIGSFAEDWNGTSWTAKTVADAQTVGLNSVSCSSAKACTAVGSLSLGTQGSAPLAERWNGTSWTAHRLPVPPGTTTGVLASVSCPTATTCVAVGFQRVFTPLAETWNGTKWSAVVPPIPSSAQDDLTAVSCLSATSCIAVGVEDAPYGPPYSDSWNGRSWKLQPVPLPAHGTLGQLDGVSCGASACQAVGYYVSSGGNQYALADRWNGTGWTAETTAALGGTWTGSLDGVSCTDAGPCTAVGGKSSSTVESALLDEYWDGTKWVAHATLTPPGATGASFDAVSCATATNCQAIGKYTTSAGTSMLAEQGS
jgi:hypothetical protein